MSEYQNQILTKRFKTKPYLTKEEKCQPAKLLNVSKQMIANRFNKMRKCKGDKEFICDDGE